MKRVGYVIWSLGLGGAEQVVIRLAAGLNRQAFEPFIFCMNEPGSFASQAIQQGIPVIALNKRGVVDWLMVWRMSRLFRKHNIDVVHTHLWGANVWGRIAARLAGVRTVIVTEHNVDTWKKWHHFLIDRALVPFTTRFIAVSQQVKTFYESNGVARGRWQVLYNGVAVSGVRLRIRKPVYEQLGISAGEQVIGLIGRLVPAKAPKLFVDTMIQIVRFHPTAKALVIGDGPLKEEVQSYVNKLGLKERILLTGTRQDVPDLLAGMDVLVFSSEREGLSMAMLEAMASGVPVVATRVGGNPELIDSGVNGLLVPPQNANALAEAVVSLLQNKEKAQDIQKRAFRRVCDRFSLARMIEQHEQLYRGEPIRIALVIDHLNRGGAQRQLVELAKGLAADTRWEPIVIALSTDQTALQHELLDAGVPVHLIHQYGAVDVSCLYQLTRLLKKLRPAIVHTWLFTADTYGRLAARQAGIRCRISGIRNTIDDMPWHYRLVNAWLSRSTDIVTINVDAIRQRLVKEARVADKKIRTVYNGIEAVQASGNGFPRDLPGARPRIAMIARLDPQKDHKTFLEAAARVASQNPSAQFLIIGEGALRAQIEEQITRLNLRGQVHLLGERRDVRLILPEIDLCVLATHYEGCSNVIMEAMAAGKPVVATRVGGNPELIVDGVTGLLVSPQDPQQMAQAMLRVLAHPEQAQQMGQAGRRRIEEFFSLSRMVKQTASLYEELLGASEEN